MAQPDTDDTPPPPGGLTDRSAALWVAVLDEYDLSPAEVRLLEEAMHTLDRADELRAVVDREGVTVTDRFGGVKLHPAHDGEQRARRDYASFMRLLGVREVAQTGTRGPAPQQARRR